MADQGVTISERPIGALIQLAGWRDSFEAAATPILQRLGFAGIGDFSRAQVAGENLCFRIAPERVLLRLPSMAAWDEIAASVDPAQTPFLDLSHARTLLRLEGAHAAELLARGLPIDLADDTFGPDRFAQSAIHTVAALVHRRSDRVFEIQLPSTFAGSIGEFLNESAESLA